MSKQYLFCVETNKKAATDSAYIKAFIDYRYEAASVNKITRNTVFLESKTRYKEKSVLKEIKSYVSDFQQMNGGSTTVFYFIDYDKASSDQDARKQFEAIQQFCNENGFILIYFSLDVEDVFWGKRVNDKEKVKSARKFVEKQMIQNVDMELLKKMDCKSGHSNIAAVLDQYYDVK